MNKNILITGSTDGIGKLAAIKLAGEGHTLYVHGRNPEKVDKVVAELKASSNHENIKGFVADLSKMNAVKQLAQQLNNELPKIDVLINNAGVFTSKIAEGENGIDIRFVVNYLAPYILTYDLLPLLENNEDARIINLSSAAQAPVSHAALQGKASISTRDAYAQSKLAITMWSFHLAKQLKDISVIAVNPGSLLNTNMVREAYGQYWSSADKGANILYELAVSDTYKGITGKYFDNDKGALGNAHSDAYDDDKIKALIEATVSTQKELFSE